ncbi:MAG: hypoxanthine phosphoribosyltransferase [Actinomycetota bacterium]|nr:hypoxanthine phosphoribosyltransferase [Actinomycetota bacterium]
MVTDGRDGQPPVDAPRLEVLVSAAQLESRVAVLAGELDAVYAGAPRPPVLVGVLKGSVLFLADLVRAMRTHVEVDFMSISSYGSGGAQSGVVRIEKDLDSDLHGRDVVIVEDIVDTGLTLNYLRKNIGARLPRSLRAITLLDKSVRRIVPVPLEHRGFDIPDVFVVGYGLDFQSLYRNVPEILSVPDLPRLAADPRLLVEPLFPPPGGVSLP